jgi:hypothetical protein
MNHLVGAIWAIGLLFPAGATAVAIGTPDHRSVLVDTAFSMGFGAATTGIVERTECAWFKTGGARGGDQGMECTLVVRTEGRERRTIIRVSSPDHLRGEWTPGTVFGQLAVDAPAATVWDRLSRVLPTALICLGSLALAAIATAAAVCDQNRAAPARN